MGDYKEFRKVVGKKIVRIEYPVSYDMDRGEYLHDPRIHLDDGSVIYFVVEEGSAEYGISVGVYRPEKVK